MLDVPRSPLNPRRLALTGLAVVTAVGALSACAPIIGVPVADDAANPKCAEVVLAVPDVLGGQSGPDGGGAATGASASSDADALHKVKTNSQATAAWGESGAAVTLRCGVEVPGPTTTSCQTVDSGGFSVDWLIIPGDDGTWTFVTYGRDPAVEVQVPPAVAETRSTAFVADLNRAVSKVPQTRTCIGEGDLTEGDQPEG